MDAICREIWKTFPEYGILCPGGDYVKKILSVFLALMVSAFLLAGCETSPSSISASTSAEQPIAVELSDYSDINQKVLSNVELISSGNEISGHSPELSIEIQAVELFDGGINISLSDSYGTDIFLRYMLDDNQLEYISYQFQDDISPDVYAATITRTYLSPDLGFSVSDISYILEQISAGESNISVGDYDIRYVTLATAVSFSRKK